MGTSCLVSWCCSFQGSLLDKTIDVLSPQAACAAPSESVLCEVQTEVSSLCVLLVKVPLFMEASGGHPASSSIALYLVSLTESVTEPGAQKTKCFSSMLVVSKLQ